MKNSLSIVFLLLFSFFVSLESNAQFSSTNSNIIEGPCYKVIESLFQEHKNDSIAINAFFKYYTTNKKVAVSKKTSPQEVVKYFIKHHELVCRLKENDLTPVLLDQEKETD